jgi:hypothetical protein
MSREDGPSLARRTLLRAALWAAGGLSVVPGALLGCKGKRLPPTCYAPPPPGPKDGTTADGELGAWRELGRLWRELGVHMRGRYEFTEGTEKLKALEGEVQHALGALPASKELRTLVEERVEHVRNSQYREATCYVMVPWSPMGPRSKVEEQMEEVRRLQAEGKLTKAAAEKAAQAIAAEAEYFVQLDGALPDTNATQTDYEKVNRIWQRYQAHELPPTEASQSAGRDAVEFEVDDPALLPE